MQFRFDLPALLRIILLLILSPYNYVKYLCGNKKKRCSKIPHLLSCLWAC